MVDRIHNLRACGMSFLCSFDVFGLWIIENVEVRPRPLLCVVITVIGEKRLLLHPVRSVSCEALYWWWWKTQWGLSWEGIVGKCKFRWNLLGRRDWGPVVGNSWQEEIFLPHVNKSQFAFRSAWLTELCTVNRWRTRVKDRCSQNLVSHLLLVLPAVKPAVNGDRREFTHGVESRFFQKRSKVDAYPCSLS